MTSWKSLKCGFYLVVFLFAAVLSLPAVGQEVKEERPAPGKNVTIMVPMRDGVKLATDVDIPKGKKRKMPVVLMRSPYGRKMGGMLTMFRGLIGDGYIIVSQDTRGRFDSEGENLPFLSAQEDGYDTVEWIAKQPWSNGQIGIIGGSALAITGYQASIADPPHLDCMLALIAPANLQSQAIMWGGQLRKDLAIGWTVGSKFSGDSLTLMTDHPFYDDFVKKYDLTFHAEKVTVPMYHIGGWYDVFSEGTIAAYLALQERGGEGARGMQRLIMGPWWHGGPVQQKQGDLEFPANSTLTSMLSSVVNWSTNCISGKVKGLKEPVKFYMMGDVDVEDERWNVWVKTTTWPPPKSAEESWSLTAAGDLTQGAAGDAKELSYKYDPSNPVTTIGGSNLVIGTHGPKDQRGVEDRDDVLIFETEVFDEPYGIAGAVTAELTVETTGCDTDFTAKLTDVYPDGRSILILDGIARTSFREYETDRLVPAKAGEQMKLKVYLGDIAHTFNKGHRMRLAVSSSNHPRFSVNMNTCREQAFPHDLIKAEYEDVKAAMAEKKEWSPVHDEIAYEVVLNTVHAGGADGSTLTVQRYEIALDPSIVRIPPDPKIISKGMKDASTLGEYGVTAWAEIENLDGDGYITLEISIIIDGVLYTKTVKDHFKSGDKKQLEIAFEEFSFFGSNSEFEYKVYESGK